MSKKLAPNLDFNEQATLCKNSMPKELNFLM